MGMKPVAIYENEKFQEFQDLDVHEVEDSSVSGGYHRYVEVEGDKVDVEIFAGEYRIKK